MGEAEYLSLVLIIMKYPIRLIMLYRLLCDNESRLR